MSDPSLFFFALGKTAINTGLGPAIMFYAAAMLVRALGWVPTRNLFGKVVSDEPQQQEPQTARIMATGDPALCFGGSPASAGARFSTNHGSLYSSGAKELDHSTRAKSVRVGTHPICSKFGDELCSDLGSRKDWRVAS
jgi:hypothetical protein